jgi:hypothetical protein
MNELAKTVGVDLGKYNNSKAQAIAYLGDSNDLAYKPGNLADVIRHYKADLSKLNITVEDARAMAPAEIEEIIMGIIRKNDFADYKTIDVVLEEMCKAYIAGVEGEGADRYDSTKFDDVGEYIAYVQKNLSAETGNYLLDAVAGYLNDALQAQLEKAASTN